MMTIWFGARTWLLLTYLMLTVSACTSEVCSSKSLDENRPTRDISCPNGKVCYGGECISACNAGTERFISCNEAADCANPARPFCVTNFCTACEESTYCVPSLNICAPVKTVLADGAVQKENELPIATEPLDAGPIDGAVFSSDAGMKPTEEAQATHVIRIDIAQITTYAQGQQPQEGALIDIQSHDVQATQYVPSTTVAQSFIANSYRCDLQTISKYVGTSSPTDIGDIGIGNGTGAEGFLGMDTYLIASFVGDQYRLASTLPSQLFNYSTVEPPTLSYILLTVGGSRDLGIPFLPIGQQGLLHVPYRLRPGANSNEGVDTSLTLQNGVQVNRQAPQKVVLLWEFERNVVGVRIVVRIVGANHELKCVGTDQFERIEIVSRLLTRLANVEGLASGATLPMFLERIYGRQLDVPIAEGKDTLVDFSVQVRDSHQSFLQYQ